jgi:hypothetical protein
VQTCCIGSVGRFCRPYQLGEGAGVPPGGVHQQAALLCKLWNVISGAFSNNLSLAFKIEAGEVVGRVKGVSVAGDIYQDLQRIEALSPGAAEGCDREAGATCSVEVTKIEESTTGTGRGSNRETN